MPDQVAANARLRAAPGAVLEWLPQETILFDGALSDTLTRLDAAPIADSASGTSSVLGRPAAGERFAAVTAASGWSCGATDGRCCSKPPASATGLRPPPAPPWGLRDQPVSATLICSAGNESTTLLGRLRPNLNAAAQANTAANRELQSVTLLSSADAPNHTPTIVCRYLGPSAARARALFARLWGCWRWAELGKPPCPPRVWARMTFS